MRSTTCVVLVVSGRPQVLTDQLGQDRRAGRLVAAGQRRCEGVADVLFGNEPFTGKLSMTWPRSAAQVPINVGDANYNPAVPVRLGLEHEVTSRAAP